jgi:uncharacterized protein YjaZ
MKKDINSFNSNIISEYHHGNAYKGIPQWANYKIGFQIMQDFLKNNPEMSIEGWTQLDGDEVLAKSKYENRLKENDHEN